MRSPEEYWWLVFRVELTAYVWMFFNRTDRRFLARAISSCDDVDLVDESSIETTWEWSWRLESTTSNCIRCTRWTIVQGNTDHLNLPSHDDSAFSQSEGYTILTDYIILTLCFIIFTTILTCRFSVAFESLLSSYLSFSEMFPVIRFSGKERQQQSYSILHWWKE